MTMATAKRPRLAGSVDTEHADFRHVEFTFEPFIKQELGIRLDHDRQLCPDFIRNDGDCPRGSDCPLRHSTPAETNFQPPAPVPLATHSRTICKHWLRGLCKKGNMCEFMHEYHLRKMPECWFFAKYGFCSNGDECMYLHVTDKMRVRECPNYRKGFCPDGPECKFKHVRRVACPDYLGGFCPKGKGCPFGHPKFEPEAEPPFSSTRIPDVSGARFLPEATFRLYRQDWLDFAADDKNQRPSGAQQNRANYNPNFNQGQPQKKFDLSTVLCYKCGEHGHFANHCPQGKPGQ